jgi:hypothetical protein
MAFEIGCSLQQANIEPKIFKFVWFHGVERKILDEITIEDKLGIEHMLDEITEHLNERICTRPMISLE